MSRSELSADSFVAASASGIHLLKPAAGGGGDAGGAGPPFSQLHVAHRAPVQAARWNRNNKVVASGSADGQVQLLYSNGSVMAVLPRDGSQLGAVTALSWSQGSKRLAAGTDRGVLHLFEMGGASTKVRPRAQRGAKAAGCSRTGGARPACCLHSCAAGRQAGMPRCLLAAPAGSRCLQPPCPAGRWRPDPAPPPARPQCPRRRTGPWSWAGTWAA